MNREFARTTVSANGVAPGEDVSQWFQLPPIPDGHRIELVLVSEFVAWFDALAGWESTITTVAG